MPSSACKKSALRSEEHTSELQSHDNLVCRLLLEIKNDSSDLGAALRTGPLSVSSYVRERCALFWGLAEQTMLRDQAHSFFFYGRGMQAASVMLPVLRVSI